jgi:hypothetical protein
MYTNLYLPTLVVLSEAHLSGTFNVPALCMLIWLYLYTAANEADGLRMAALLVSPRLVVMALILGWRGTRGWRKFPCWTSRTFEF